MKRVMIVGSGNDFLTDKISQAALDSDYIIASDGGYDTLMSAGIVPDIVIGDMDSIKGAVKSDVKTERHPAEKEYSDSELSIIRAMGMKPDLISVFGVTGDYPDHTLANYLNLFRNYDGRTEIEIITAKSRVTVLKEGCNKLNGLKNRRFSLFFFSDISGLKLDGVKYSFNKSDLTMLDYSLSNVIIEDTAEISFDKGRVLCIIFDGGYE